MVLLHISVKEERSRKVRDKQPIVVDNVSRSLSGIPPETKGKEEDQ